MINALEGSGAFDQCPHGDDITCQGDEGRSFAGLHGTEGIRIEKLLIAQDLVPLRRPESNTATLNLIWIILLQSAKKE